MATDLTKKTGSSNLLSNMSFAGSIQMIFFSMLICTIVSQCSPNKMAAANFLWLHFLNNRSSIQSFFFLDQWEMAQWNLSDLTTLVGEKKKSLISMKWKFT